MHTKSPAEGSALCALGSRDVAGNFNRITGDSNSGTRGGVTHSDEGKLEYLMEVEGSLAKMKGNAAVQTVTLEGYADDYARCQIKWGRQGRQRCPRESTWVNM